MGVASHLGIRLAEYDRRIRTFIPDYAEMLDVAASAVPLRARTIVDLGTGTGALAARCLARARDARLVGVDADREILQLAARRLGRRGTWVADSFLRAPVPACDVVVTSFALHHVRTRAAKRALYRRLFEALRPRGRVIAVDCHPSAERSIARAQHRAWRRHLMRFYSPHRASQLLAAWGREDRYVPLDAETRLMTDSGFGVEVMWRRGAFAVLLARR